jgi:lipoate-protein ligase B
MTLLATKKTGCRTYCLGIIDYARSFQLQKNLCHERAGGMIGDILLIMEHSPVLTIGKAGCKPEHMLVSADVLEREKILVCPTNRGGGISYHGPGQLLCYPVMDLRGLGISVRNYIEKLEEVVVRTLSRYNIMGNHITGSPGIWVGDAEIASVGINVSHGITMHGFTLNVSNDLLPFSYIAPCGVSGKKMTTMSQVCGLDIPSTSVVADVITCFSSVFNTTTTLGEPESLEAFYG